ncbi:Esc1p [Saccharomyces cerevisiae YJM1386]|nr:Esc1p [Saccharomyces cerevisiae YJM1386]
MSKKKETFTPRANKLNLTTPRRKLKILSSLLDADEDSKMKDQHGYSRVHSDKYRVAKPTQHSTLHESISSRRSSHIHNKSLHEDSARALSWVDSLINRGKSILTTLEKEDALFERSLEEERQRFQLHDSLMNKYTGNSKSHQRLIDLRKSQYGTDTSFQNNDEIPLDSFISSPLPDAEDESSSNIDSDKDEDLEGKQSLIKDFDLENDEYELSEEEKNSDGQSSPSIMILSDEEYAEEGALQDVSNDEYAEEEGQVERKNIEQEQANVENATQISSSDSSEGQNYSEGVEMELEDDIDVESDAEKDESQDEEGTEHSVDFSKYMQPRTNNTETPVIEKYESDEHQAHQGYSEDGAFDFGSVNISVDDESEDDESQDESYSANAENVYHHNEHELDDKELIENIESSDSESQSAQESEQGSEDDFEYKMKNEKSTSEETENTSESRDQGFAKDAYTKNKVEQQENDEEREKDDIIRSSLDKNFHGNNNKSEYSENVLENETDPAIVKRENQINDVESYDVTGKSVESDLHEHSPDNLYDLAARAMLQFQQSRNSNCPQKEEQISESYLGHSNGNNLSGRSLDEFEEQIPLKDFTGENNNNLKTDRGDLSSSVEIEVEKVSEKKLDGSTEKELVPLSTDTAINNSSLGNEDSIYYSLDDADAISENLTDVPLMEIKTTPKYEVVISESVYSSTSYEDNAVAMPPQVEYTSPFMNDPFNSLNDDYEKKHDLLKSTLAALAPAFTKKDAKFVEAGVTKSCLTSTSGHTNIFHTSKETKQVSDLDESTENVTFENENTDDENKNQSKNFPAVANSTDKSTEDNTDEKYFSAINYTNVTGDSSCEDIIETASNVEENLRYCEKDMNEAEMSSGDERVKQNDDGSKTQISFSTDSPDNFQESNDNTEFSSTKYKVRDSDLEDDESLKKELTKAEVVDKLDEENSEDSYEQDYADPEPSNDEGSNENIVKGTKKDTLGIVEPENEKFNKVHEEETLFEANVSSSVNVQDRDMHTDVINQEAQANYEAGERKYYIQNTDTEEAHISIIERIDENAIGNNMEILERSCVEKTHNEVLFERRATTIENTKALENNTNMHDQVSQACSDSDRDQDSTAEKNVEGFAKHNLDIRVSSSEIESVEPLKPESDRSNIFSSPIRVIGAVVKGVGTVVDVAESFVKKIDVMDSESDDNVDIGDYNQDIFNKSNSTDASVNMKSASSKERDSDEDEAVILGGVTAEAHNDNGNNSHVINIDPTTNGANEEDSDVFRQQVKDKENLHKSEEPLVEGLQSEQHFEKKDHSENEEECDTIYGDITSANIHSNAPDDIKRQQLLKNLSDLENYSQRLTEDSRRGKNQEESDEVNTSRERDLTFEKSVNEKYAGAIEEDTFSELDISIQHPEHEEDLDLSNNQERSIEELNSEPEEAELYELEIEGPTETAASSKMNDDERQRGNIPSTDLPSDPPSDKEEVTGSYPYSNSENITAEKSAPTSPEVYEIFSDTPNEVPMEINDEIPATTLEKHDKTNVTSVLDDRSEHLSSHDVDNEPHDNSINIKVNEGEEPEHQAVDIPVKVEVKEEQEEMPSKSVLEEQKPSMELINDKSSPENNNDEETNREKDKTKAKKKSRKRNYNSRRRKRKITEGSSAASNTKRRRGHEPKSRGQNTHPSVDK